MQTKKLTIENMRQFQQAIDEYCDGCEDLTIQWTQSLALIEIAIQLKRIADVHLGQVADEQRSVAK